VYSCDQDNTLAEVYLDEEDSEILIEAEKKSSSQLDFLDTGFLAAQLDSPDILNLTQDLASDEDFKQLYVNLGIENAMQQAWVSWEIDTTDIDQFNSFYSQEEFPLTIDTSGVVDFFEQQNGELSTYAENIIFHTEMFLEKFYIDLISLSEEDRFSVISNACLTINESLLDDLESKSADPCDNCYIEYNVCMENAGVSFGLGFTASITAGLTTMTYTGWGTNPVSWGAAGLATGTGLIFTSTTYAGAYFACNNSLSNCLQMNNCDDPTGGTDDDRGPLHKSNSGY
jgi:hypothetical protein